ncbi:hypothetical protein J5289_18540 [Rhizobium sp. B230/85]|nr:hypothetical protein [Rhizobium sp. L58/93]MBO9136282.1 hypothetical protein [Rhizobium sp. B209b/85]MBO9170834.1 hypothetical protein [Rhizobium sp. L245/93]MBO9186751.1 hypothetical protein [Rhizobium sp. E27B/91]QXZ86218.1 hypothetical protein J5287_24395 [Rhizobium sp. K1/93]QXZ92326.1 hypothetical protein J5280_24795 [Rhizobium sp. K15/93]QXZ98576.1 hypothetical protein J5289_18540 [Rhizobium sp. B230/85]QYA04458.1 hypothetical protein J5278_19955 [Rhizobium sp. B21/90]
MADNAAAHALAGMPPLTIEMDHHRRQKDRLPAGRLAAERIFGGDAWSLEMGDFVIYYSNGRVPQLGIAILGEIEGDVSMFDRSGKVTVKVEKANLIHPAWQSSAFRYRPRVTEHSRSVNYGRMGRFGYADTARMASYSGLSIVTNCPIIP